MGHGYCRTFPFSLWKIGIWRNFDSQQKHIFSTTKDLCVGTSVVAELSGQLRLEDHETDYIYSKL